MPVIPLKGPKREKMEDWGGGLSESFFVSGGVLCKSVEVQGGI
jgi:hypothetical protein